MKYPGFRGRSKHPDEPWFRTGIPGAETQKGTLLQMKVLLFGVTKDIIGKSPLEIPTADLGNLGTVGGLKSYLQAAYPRLGELSSLAVAVNRAYAQDEDDLPVLLVLTH